MNEMLNVVHGMFWETYPVANLLASALLVLGFGYFRAPFMMWSLLLLFVAMGVGAPIWSIGALLVVAIIGTVKPLRRHLISSFVMKVMGGILPKISDTERTALDAGVVWIEKDLFSGSPDFKALLEEPYPTLTAEEQAFVDGPVEELCAMIDEWQIWEKREIPTEVWDFLKKEKFLGMIIPKEFGGLGFSAMAHSYVIMKLASRSLPVCITTMVPNSLGPAELLTHYGTEKQKKHYLPRLASGDEIPCFALTEPNAGSDAGALTSHGELFKGEDGKLYIKLNWNKRWITLAAISTILGLAFRLRDPQNLLGKGEDVGITCALVPANTPGVVLGKQHDPMGVPFFNCPTEGNDVVVEAEESIIGGVASAGQGWKMLMESLGAGRGVSLPAQSTGGSKIATRIATAHSSVRKQFGLPVGKFEGVEEPLARMAGYTYILEAFQRLTLGALDKGIKPPVITAIAKYNATELGRKVINDAMDVMGGTAISRGPRNVVANIYASTPIGITVEGANILTRTLMIFGQGALRAHPYAYREIAAVEKNDLAAFDDAFWGHVGHVVHNGFRSVLLSITRGRIASSPVSGPTARYYQKLAWCSASFAIMADMSMAFLGGSLKLREKITGRFADILSWMYIGFSVLRRFEAEGRKKEDLIFVQFSMKYAFGQMQRGFDGIFANLRVPFGLGWAFNKFLRWWSGMNRFGGQIYDDLTHHLATAVLTDSEQRDRITADGVYITQDPAEMTIGRLEHAFKVVKRSEKAERKIKIAIKKKVLPKARIKDLLEEALKKEVITQQDFKDLKESEQVRWDAIQVDSFSCQEYLDRSSGDKKTPLKKASGE